MTGLTSTGSFRRRRRQVVLQAGAILLALSVATILIASLLAFPWDPAPGPVRLTFALIAVLLFLPGVLIVILGRRLERRFAAAHVMAAAAVLLLVAAAGDGWAWLAGILGWSTVAVMSVWGARLARGIVCERQGEEPPL